MLEEPARKRLRRSDVERNNEKDSKGSDDDYANTITDGRSSNSSSGSNSGSGDEEDRASAGTADRYENDNENGQKATLIQSTDRSSSQTGPSHHRHHRHHDRDRDSDDSRAQKEPKDRDPTPVKRRSDGKKHVEKGSLNLEDLIEAKNRAISKNKNKVFKTEEEIKEERRAANRLSAFQSRQRRKIIIDDLTKTVARLSKDNAEHRDTISLLKTQLKTVTIENEFLRSQVYASKNSPRQTQQQSRASVEPSSMPAVMLGGSAEANMPPAPASNGGRPTANPIANVPPAAARPNPPVQHQQNASSQAELLNALTVFAALQQNQRAPQPAAPVAQAPQQYLQQLLAPQLQAQAQQFQQQQAPQQPSNSSAQSVAQLLQELIRKNQGS